MSSRPSTIVLVASLICVGCDPADISVCELPEELNTCEGHDDCLLAYCGVDCCGCPRVASQRQFDETYCMVPVGEGLDAAHNKCEEAREQICEPGSCTAAICPRPTSALCEEGRCIAGY